MRGLLALVAVLVATFALLAVGGLGQSCPAGLLEGTLVSRPGLNGESEGPQLQGAPELMLRQGSGMVHPIRWPWGYQLRTLDDGRLAVADLWGGVKASEHDVVAIGGGADPRDESRWVACGNMDSLRR